MRVAVGLAALIACAAALCSTAAADEAQRLARMPLPRQALGTGGAALGLLKDSGVDTNADAARNAGDGVTAADLARFGRITGYTLDYGLPAGSPPQSLFNVQSIAELYRDVATAKRGLVFWRGVTRRLNGTTSHGVMIHVVPFPVRVADGAFAFELTYSRAGRPLFYLGDVVFRTGDMLGAVFVAVRDESGVRARARELADRLSLRMK